ncbi:MAG: winged helix-turn-helix transcriptional regulator [Oscillospiraceae bacterium]|nr:winged helix-turn-helix transcriptional regulator [Oscillospiraceae bacterium]MBQ3049376.1 winged helix-turn-helix transcriptional regulator [Oscillospiraceae bacterium]MBQ9939554.1 winged helix-turn-helix transcriptional regulator [Oscillospiraceae bacterium]
MVENRLMRLFGRMDMIGLLRRLLCQKEFTKLGLYKGQLGILEYVIRNPGCGQKAVAEHMSVTAASIAKSTERMQRAGMLTKNVDEENLRCNRLYVTEKGEEVSKASREMFNKLDEKMFEGFSDEELGQLERYLERIIANLSENPEETVDFDFKKMCELRKKIQEYDKKREEE